MRLALILLVVASASAYADAPKAKKLNTEGMKLYGKKNYSGALEQFDKAIAEDPEFVLAHYNAASMASLKGDNPRVIKELMWLAASKDPAAAKALVQGKTDTDLERASMHPKVRELLGLPALDKVPLADLLVAYTGIWGMDAGACGPPAVTLTFKKGGTFTLHTEWACDANHDVSNESGKWAVTDGKLTLSTKKVLPAGTTGALGACFDADAGTCLTTSDGAINLFRRGAGELQ